MHIYNFELNSQSAGLEQHAEPAQCGGRLAGGGEALLAH